MFRIPSSTLLTPIFGDPCPGYMKELRIQYEICGVKGSVTVFEVRGFLRKKLIIQSSPTIKPLIFAGSCRMWLWYGSGLYFPFHTDMTDNAIDMAQK